MDIIKNYNLVLFSGDFVEIITPIVTVLSVFITYFLTRREFKFKTYHEEQFKVLCKLYSILEELKFEINRTVSHSDIKYTGDYLKQSNDVYQNFNLYYRKKLIFIDDDLLSDIRIFDGEWLKIYAKMSFAYRDKLQNGYQGWNDQYHEAVESVVSGNLDNLLKEINKKVRKYLGKFN